MPAALSETERDLIAERTRSGLEATGERLLALWWEYIRRETPEVRFVKAPGKLKTFTQHNQGQNLPDFDYDCNRSHGRAKAIRICKNAVATS